MPKVMLLLFLLTDKPMSVLQIAASMGVSIRQAFRFIVTLENMGCELQREKGPRYRVQVVEWPEEIRKYKFEKHENRV